MFYLNQSFDRHDLKSKEKSKVNKLNARVRTTSEADSNNSVCESYNTRSRLRTYSESGLAVREGNSAVASNLRTETIRKRFLSGSGRYYYYIKPIYDLKSLTFQVTCSNRNNITRKHRNPSYSQKVKTQLLLISDEMYVIINSTTSLNPTKRYRI